MHRMRTLRCVQKKQLSIARGPFEVIHDVPELPPTWITVRKPYTASAAGFLHLIALPCQRSLTIDAVCS
jgi:hypothetical protein